MKETKTTESQAAIYMRQFNNNAEEAIEAYRAREKIIKSFSQKNNLTEIRAK